MSTVYFAEEQWLWRNRILQRALASGVAFCALRWRAVGRGRALAEGISCAAAASFLATVRLDVRVGPGMLEIEFWPFVRRRIPSREIVSWQAVGYRPLVGWGGWGIRWRPGGWAYTVFGDRGVRVRLAGGREVLVGSRRPEELAEAIAASRGERL
ncbi:MAG: hypothetical protein IRY88_03050 [Rubrobacteraceae bacterium]|nr:hypothetical protein [Rubrobacteraceae bacterium]